MMHQKIIFTLAATVHVHTFNKFFRAIQAILQTNQSFMLAI